MQISCRPGSISETQLTPCKVEHAASLLKSDYSHYLVWIAKSFNTNVLQHFHQKIMITYITYSIENDYYIHYLSQKSENLETENREPKTKD